MLCAKYKPSKRERNGRHLENEKKKPVGINFRKVLDQELSNIRLRGARHREMPHNLC